MSGASAAILHVEDDASLRRLVQSGLERLGGHVVRSAASGAEALALAGQFVPQLLLLDINLPDMNGLAVLRALRDLPGYATVPAVLLTSVRELGVRDELRALGVREVLYKPVRPRLLAQAIDRVLART